ncbi:MAG TPA: hypothetical protein VGG88_07610 [Gaiellaceae bacterium]
MEQFAGARARLDRAQEQTQVLQAEFQEFAARSPHAVREIYDAEIGRKRAEYLVLEEFPDLWSAVVGEIAYDVRSALDHAVYELTCIENDGPLGHTGFPIFEDEQRYDELKTRGDPALGSGVFKVRGLNPYAKSAIRSLQPFEARKTKPFEEPALSLLAELNAVDRQRTIPLCRLRWTGSTIRNRRPVRDLRFHWEPTLENGAVLASWTPMDSLDGFDMDVDLDFDVGFGMGEPAPSRFQGRPVVEILEQIGDAVAETVSVLEATVRLTVPT